MLCLKHFENTFSFCIFCVNSLHRLSCLATVSPNILFVSCSSRNCFNSSDEIPLPWWLPSLNLYLSDVELSDCFFSFMAAINYLCIFLFSSNCYWVNSRCYWRCCFSSVHFFSFSYIEALFNCTISLSFASYWIFSFSVSLFLCSSWCFIFWSMPSCCVSWWVL